MKTRVMFRDIFEILVKAGLTQRKILMFMDLLQNFGERRFFLAKEAYDVLCEKYGVRSAAVRNVLGEFTRLGLLHRISRGVFSFDPSLSLVSDDIIERIVRVHSLYLYVPATVLKDSKEINPKYKFEINGRTVVISVVKSKDDNVDLYLTVRMSSYPVPLNELNNMINDICEYLENEFNVKVKREKIRILQVELNLDYVPDIKIYAKGLTTLEAKYGFGNILIRTYFKKDSGCIRREIRIMRKKGLKLDDIVNIVREIFFRDLISLRLYRLEREIEEMKKEMKKVKET